MTEFDKSKLPGYIILIIIGLATGPFGWLILFLWLFKFIKTNDVKMKFEAKGGGILKNIKKANEEIKNSDDNELTQILSRSSEPLEIKEKSPNDQSEVLRILIFVTGIIVIIGLLVYMFVK